MPARQIIRIVVIVVLLSLSSCENATATVMPSQTATLSPSETFTPTVTASETLSPTPPATPTETPIVFSTPTIEAASTIPGGIIEMTPLGGQPHTGWFSPNATMNIRACPATNCAIIRQTSARVPFYDVIKTPEGDQWLCLDPAVPCQSFIAWYIVGFQPFGTVAWDQ